MAHITDTHIHLQDFNQDFALKLLDNNSLFKFILISANHTDFNKISTLYQSNLKKIIPSFGYHPWYADNFCDIDLLQHYLTQNPNSLIGEIGLDGIKSPPTPAQHELFSKQLKLAHNLDRPIIIHGAKAFNALSSYEKELKSKKFVYHSFRPNHELLKFLIKTNAYIGLGNHFINNPKAKDVFAKLPLDKILFETDAPYQQKEADYEKNTLQNLKKLANLSNMAENELNEILEKNTMEFIKC